MKNTLIFTSIYIKTLLKNRRSAIILWLTPIFFLLGAALMGSQLLKEEARVQQFKVAIVNEDVTVETELVIRQLTESPHLNQLMKTVKVDKQTAEAYLHANEIAAIIHIPKGFSRDVARGKNTPVTVIGNKQRPLQSQLIRYVMESAADFTSAAQSGINTIDHFMEEAGFSKSEQKDQFKRAVLSFSLHVLGRGELFERVEQPNLFQQSILHYYAISFYVLLMMVWSYMGLFLLKANMNRSIDLRLAGMGFLKIQSVFARMLAAYLFVLGSSLLVSIPFSIWQGWTSGSQVAVLIGATMLIILVFLSLFVMLEALIDNEKVVLIVSLLVMVLGATIGEHFIPSVYFPEWLKELNAFSLNGWILKWMFSLHQEWTVYASGRLGLFLLLFSFGCLFVAGWSLQRRKERV
ncbi:ABC transporter permease [Bacillus sp. V3B]|uniref:ABC transporter permease n=1 Tax=Bacillus sp. V3B TaxID=2804915 RepID=UPI00210D7343|nr:ABC transporter permease [Bacillus sp. V3B]MCQ6277094.1 ABC transporter permease [Bacillus sp. V3B]